MAEKEYDLIVVGSGAGALLGAIRGQEQGLKTLVVEKTDLFGGTSALSGGGIWIPVNYDQKNAGVKDDLETAFSYMKRCVRGMATDDRVLAYVETANKMAEYLRQIGIPYRAMAKYADYYPHIEGSKPGGAPWTRWTSMQRNWVWLRWKPCVQARPETSCLVA